MLVADGRAIRWVGLKLADDDATPIAHFTQNYHAVEVVVILMENRLYNPMKGG